MCKLILMPHIPAGKSKNAWRLARAVTPAMTRHDNDGFGYAAVTTHMNGDSGNEVFLAEKWADPKDAWSNSLPAVFDGLQSALQGGLDTQSYKHYGYPLNDHNKRPAVRALMLHSRFSTCGGGVENSHPFVLEDKEGPWAAFVHNGVVSTQNLRMEQSTCDSEGILNKLRDEHAFYIPENLQTALAEIRGYYAFGVLTVTYEDGWIMDIVKDSTAQLSAVYVEEIGAVLYATSPEHVEGACKKLKWKRPRIARMRNNTRIRYSVNTGKVLIVDHFLPAEYRQSTWQQSHAHGNYHDMSRLGWRDHQEDDEAIMWARARARGTESAVANDFDGDSKLSSLNDDAAIVQAALHAMETRDKADKEQVLTIDPSTGAIEMPDGSVIQLADESNRGEEEVKV